jgi:116 kDa U5 small nuclear ribonucleoprotein component
MSLVLPNSKDKSYLINICDTPGHPNFTDEMCSVLRVCDGALLLVDCIEGVMLQTE